MRCPGTIKAEPGHTSVVADEGIDVVGEPLGLLAYGNARIGPEAVHVLLDGEACVARQAYPVMPSRRDAPVLGGRRVAVEVLADEGRSCGLPPSSEVV
jgi:hypothetical protein